MEAPIVAFVAALNRDDVKAAAATHVAAPSLVDEVPPFLWNGAGAIARWLGDLARSEKAEGKREGVVGIGVPIREVVAGDHAYVIVPGTYRYDQKKVPMLETAQWTFELVKQAGAWKIAGWTWTAPEAVTAH